MPISTKKRDDIGASIIVVGAGYLHCLLSFRSTNIGCRVAGIATGIAIKQQLKYSNFKVGDIFPPSVSLTIIVHTKTGCIDLRKIGRSGWDMESK